MTRRAAIGAAAGILAAGLALSVRSDLLGRFGPPCLFHELTHLYCPGCGGTRSAILLLRGDVLGAIRMNVFAVLVLACVPLGLSYTILKDRPIDWTAAKGRPGQCIAAFVVAFFILRNIPIAPFTYLAPIDLAQYDQDHARTRTTPPALIRNGSRKLNSPTPNQSHETSS